MLSLRHPIQHVSSLHWIRHNREEAEEGCFSTEAARWRSTDGNMTGRLVQSKTKIYSWTWLEAVNGKTGGLFSTCSQVKLKVRSLVWTLQMLESLGLHTDRLLSAHSCLADKKKKKQESHQITLFHEGLQTFWFVN